MRLCAKLECIRPVYVRRVSGEETLSEDTEIEAPKPEEAGPEHAGHALDADVESGRVVDAPPPDADAPGSIAQNPFEGPPGDGVRRHPDLRYVRLERWTGQLGNLAVLVPLLVGVGVLYALTVFGPKIPVLAWRIPALIWIVLAPVLVAFADRWPAIVHEHMSWSLDARGLDVRRGVLWREEIAVPSSRIQHTDVKQGPLERRLGLATLVVHTAGTRHAAVAVPGLAVEDARAIRDYLGRAVDEDDAV